MMNSWWTGMGRSDMVREPNGPNGDAESLSGTLFSTSEDRTTESHNLPPTNGSHGSNTIYKIGLDPALAFERMHSASAASASQMASSTTSAVGDGERQGLDWGSRSVGLDGALPSGSVSPRLLRVGAFAGISTPRANMANGAAESWRDATNGESGPQYVRALQTKNMRIHRSSLLGSIYTQLVLVTRQQTP